MTLRRTLTFWRRSLQARVVVSTVLLSAVVIGAVGWFLLQQTRDGLVESRVSAVVAEADNETDEAVYRLQSAVATESDPNAQASELFQDIIQRGDLRGFDVLLAGPLPTTPTDAQVAGSIAGVGVRTSPGLDPSSIPSDLQARMVDADGSYREFTTIAFADDRPSTPGVVVATNIVLPADGQRYTLYYAFPLTQEQRTLNLVERALLTAGVLLLMLVAAVTWLVLHQIVVPIRDARRVAEKLSSGDLDQRMDPKGEDDLARLGHSFNHMAAGLEHQIGQLEELSRVQRRFVSDVSHELRTPLTTVRMAGDMLHDAREQFAPDAARAAELLQTELDRFEGLLTDLLEISRFDAGAAVLETDDVDLAAVARRVVEATLPLAEQRGTRVVLEPTEGDCLAQADVRRVERIVRNLVANAIDHAESSEVVVRVAGNEQAAAVSVRDRGVGLGPGEAQMVFNRFWRADPARARTTGGTGLGLSIALEDTHLHGGWLQAWGSPGEGALFRLTLPRRAGAALQQSPLPLVPEDFEEPATPAARVTSAAKVDRDYGEEHAEAMPR